MTKAINRINRLLVWVSGAALVLMMLVGFANVLLRTCWQPLKGAFEIIGFLGALTTAMALGFTQIHKNHVGVDILTSSYSKKIKHIVNVVSYAISAPFFTVVSWRVAAWGTTIRQSGETSETLQIIYYPVIYVVAAGFFFLAVILFFDLYEAGMAMFGKTASLRPGKKDGAGRDAEGGADES